MKSLTESITSYKSNLLALYSDLEQKFQAIGIDVATYNTPVNFKESLSTPIHRWYGYKEGFSPSFVRSFISEHSFSDDDIVFDPFGGVGTTSLEAIKLGHDAYHMDVNPLGNFATKVKTRHYSKGLIHSINNEIELLNNLEDYHVDVSIDNATVQSYFSPITWLSILKIKSFILSIEDEIIHSLFDLALLSLVSEISTHRKDGNGVKRKRKEPKPLSFVSLAGLIIDKIRSFIDDINQTNLIGNCDILEHSNIQDYVLPKKPKIVLTSPPYANCFDYSKVYLSELWIGGFFRENLDQKQFRDKSISSHVHYKWASRNEAYSSEIVEQYILPLLSHQQLWSKNICPMLKGYFSDMGKFLKLLSHNLASNATIGIVVGNSVYGNVPIATDLIIADLATKLGYTCQGIKIYRQIISSSQQIVNLSGIEKHFIRESLIVLKWRN